MFRRRQHDDPSALSLDELRDSLSDRLRLVFDFATLGAYDEQEYTEPTDDASAEVSSTTDSCEGNVKVAVRKCCEHARAQQGSVEPHVQVTAIPCDDPEARLARCSQEQGRGTVTRKRLSAGVGAERRRRIGRVAVPPQPCTWLDAQPPA
jgi:hypothetical protein